MSRSKRKILQFIQDYKYHEVLWNHKHKYFNNKLKRKEALMDLAAKYKILFIFLQGAPKSYE